MRYRDIDATVADRAADLLARLTPDERLAMLHQAAPAIERLGVAEYRTGCEVLHGVAWLGVATVFPQPIGLAATWDTELIERVGEVVSTEVRAKRSENPLISLNVWAPVVNTLRHPGWGRNEEGFSEDPHLTAHFGTAYARGLRGRHERVWKTVPALKHFLAYSNETDRSATSSNMSLRTLHEEELPAFRAPIESEAAGSMMLAYNQVNGAPAHTQPELVAEARSWTDGSLAIVSDAGAPTFVVSVQGAQPDMTHAAAALVRSGMDSFTDNDADAQPTLTNLRAALEAGLLTSEDIDRAVLRLLEMRVRSGEFDADADPYAGIGMRDLDTPAARELAREAAAAGVVVLRDDAGMLPLTTPRSIAVVGPLADRVLTDWYSGTPPYAVGVAQGLADRYPDADVRVETGADTVALRATSNGAYLRSDPTGAVVAATADSASEDALWDVTDWGDGVLTLRAHASGRLLTGGAWPMRADAERVGGWVVQESFRRHVHPDGTWSLLHLGSGRWVRVSREVGIVLAEGVTLDRAERFAVRTVRSGMQAVADAARSADLAVVVVGNDPHLAGRETEDRPHLFLPEASTGIWRAVEETGTPTVLTIVSSYPYVLGDAAAASTVVWSSHAGQELGHGIADVLSGDVEPRGRLAQSWPADPAQAGDLFDYDTQRQQATYRHQPEPYAFAFGHGLTYSSVAYEEVTLDAEAVDAPAPTHRHPAFGTAGSVVVRVRVANRGSRAAEELVQVYGLAPEGLPIPPARRLLLGYRRARLEAGETREIEVPFQTERFAVWDEAVRLEGAVEDWVHAGALRVQPGIYRIAAGPSADVLPVHASLSVR
ncbi:glycoside hydrolase family 3 C-terminal domain-containing protein [Microbacterium sp.]|uniref:glycoside hydrolase family 3 C-terminal domain-containing protein n=1 Tax=Microbacterium sp. TaxID=51671 RepID=UPI0039E35C7A